MFDEQKFEDAETLINKALKIIEEQPKILPYVYVDRARIKIALNKHDQALSDLNFVMNCEDLTLEDKSSALILKSIIFNDMGQKDQAQICWEEYKSCNIMPDYDETDEYLIIRNAPQCSCYIKLIAAYCLETKVCKELSDIKMFKPDLPLNPATVHFRIIKMM